MVLTLFHAYRACDGPKLSGEALLGFRDQMQAHVSELQDVQDPVQTTLDVMLDLVPTFARVRELKHTLRIPSGERRATLCESQVVWAAAVGESLQSSLDAYCAEERVNEGCVRRFEVTVTGDTAFVLLNTAMNTVCALRHEPLVTLGGRLFRTAGFLLLAHGHCTTLVNVGPGWVLFNDLRPGGDVVEDLAAFLNQHAWAVRVVMLRASPDVLCPMLTNLPHFRNSCYMNAVLQLLFHCDDFVQNLEHELEMTDDERAERSLVPFRTEQEV